MIHCTLLIFNETHMIRKDFSAIPHLGAIAVVIFVFVVVIVLSVWSVVCERKDWLWAECRMRPITKHLRALTLHYYRVFKTTKLSFSFCPKVSRKKKMSSYLNWTICGSLDISCSNKLFCFVATNLQLLWWPLNRGLVSGLVGMSRYPSTFHTNEEIFSFLIQIFSGICEKDRGHLSCLAI